MKIFKAIIFVLITGALLGLSLKFGSLKGIWKQGILSEESDEIKDQKKQERKQDEITYLAKYTANNNKAMTWAKTKRQCFLIIKVYHNNLDKLPSQYFTNASKENGDNSWLAHPLENGSQSSACINPNRFDCVHTKHEEFMPCPLIRQPILLALDVAIPTSVMRISITVDDIEEYFKFNVSDPKQVILINGEQKQSLYKYELQIN